MFQFYCVFIYMKEEYEHFSEWTPLKDEPKNKESRYDVRQEILSYLDKFFCNFILYKDTPVKQKLARKHWVDTIYEELSPQQREEIFSKIKSDIKPPE